MNRHDTLNPCLVAADEHENLFVRLSPDVLSALAAQATAASSSLDESSPWTANNHQKWIILPQDPIHFLPLEIYVGNRVIYASFNGGVLEGSSGKRVLFFEVVCFCCCPSGPMIDLV